MDALPWSDAVSKDHLLGQPVSWRGLITRCLFYVRATIRVPGVLSKAILLPKFRSGSRAFIGDFLTTSAVAGH
jgi:hypothetical protein